MPHECPTLAVLSVAGGTVVTMKPITWDSSREEVLAAVAEHDRVVAEIEQVEFPAVPEGFVGCVASVDGTAIACYGPIEPDPVREAQDRAGEEDQSVPGWDQGA